MYCVRYRALKERLRERSLRDDEVLPYFILTCLLLLLPFAYEEFGLLILAWRVIITFGGILYVYHCNGGAYGFDLVQKFLVLGWIVNIRILLVFLPVFIMLLAFRLSTETLDGVMLLLVPITDIILFQRIGRHIRDTTQ